MKNKFILSESEITDILNQHRLVKEQGNPSTSTTSTEQIPINTQLEKIRGYGCFNQNSPVIKTKFTEPNRQFAIKQESKKNPGKFGYFFIDNAIGVLNDLGKFEIITQKWDCPKMKEQQNLEAQKKSEQEKLDAQKKSEQGKLDIQKQAFIDMAINLGYKEEKELTADEIASGSYKEIKVPGSEKFFPPNGITMWGSPSGIAKEGGKISTKFGDISKSQTIDKSICKDAIDTYYEGFKTKKDIPQATFDSMKKVVQSCVSTYEGKWGGFLGIDLENTKKYVEILRGGIGGPSRRGEDSKWRLN